MQITRTHHHLRAAAVACTLAVLGHAGTTHASSRQALSSTGVDADATGDAKVDVRSRPSGLRGKLEVRGRRLDGGAVYQITLDGVRIGSLTASRGGTGKARFDTSPRRNVQSLGVDPRGRTVAVVDAVGAVVLSGTLAAGGQVGGADTRCCLPDGGGDGPDECEDRTPAECVAQGGVDLGPGSCLPNPCGGGNPPPGGGNGNAVARVRCERRNDRSKISVDANDVAGGTYAARVTSGGNTATSGAQGTIGDEVEFDFDSDRGDIAEGATPIASTFIQGLQVTGEVLDASGTVIAAATVTCEAK